ncbi:MAG: zinc ribbon domain-containing protein [Actinomycetota bacterium]|nr:zinc ribbon domain-containing protein [Actinomycetota bacterium]
MACLNWGAENQGGKFCRECGRPLSLACPGCGAPYEAGDKFCSECGASLKAAAGLTQTSSPITEASTPVMEAPTRKRRLVSGSSPTWSGSPPCRRTGIPRR